MPPPRTVALIGATGFIGRRVAKMLIAAGHKVVAPIRATSPRREDLPPEMKTVPCSLQADDPDLQEVLGGADAVIYAAGAVRGGSFDDFLPANVHGVQAVADLLVRGTAPAPPILLLSSLAASQPQLSDYARSKREGERVLEEYPQLAATILRPPAVYGPGDQEMRPLFDAMQRGLAVRVGPPEQRLSLLHADDLARAILAWLAANPLVGHGCLELHDGREEGYLFDEIAAACDRPVRVLPSRKRSFPASRGPISASPSSPVGHPCSVREKPANSATRAGSATMPPSRKRWPGRRKLPSAKESPIFTARRAAHSVKSSPR